jgi:hypothetical protein
MATRHLSRLVASMLAAGLLFGSATAQQLMIYPGKGQSHKQQERDRYQCHGWAVQQSGFDPSTAQAPRGQAYAGPPPEREAPQGGVLRGAGRGALLGVVGGAIGGNAGKGAAIGAGVGALFGGMRRNQQREREAQQQQAYQQRQAQAQAQQQARYSGEHSAYNRALAACLRGRGYTVS